MANQFSEILEAIKKAKNIGILTHKIPDGDAIGSSCGLAYILKNMDKRVEVLFEKPLKSEYDELNLSDIIAYEPTFEYDLIISTDCGDTTRFGIHESIFTSHKNTINIDHHLTNTKFAKLNYVDEKRSSASEYMFDIFDSLNVEIPLKSQELFYLGIIRDCGAFMYNNTSSQTHRIVAKMIDNGIKFDIINEHFMQTTALKSIILQRYALNSMEFLHDNRVVIMNLPYSVFEKEQCSIEDTGSLVSIGVSIEGVQLAVMISEAQPNVHKISFRSRESIDSSLVAQAFGGGGHKRASGCQLKGAYSKVKNQILTEIKKFFKENI